MHCDTLPDTGAPATLVLAVVAAGCLVVGTMLVTQAPRSRVRPVVLLALLVMATAYATLSGASAQAVSPDCETSGPDSVRITQTSVLTGLRPEVAPLTITGRVTNNSDDDTYITAVTVTLMTVSKAPHVAAGTCDVSDYILTDTRMPVGEALGPHESLTFSGASIGFGNTSANQDACKGATVHLRYYSAATPDPSR